MKRKRSRESRRDASTIGPDVDEVVRARCAHLEPVELRLAMRIARCPADAIDGPPEGVIVGESPGPNTVGRRPLLPWPVNSAGQRLLAMSGLHVGQYLGRFVRRNLFDFHVGEGGWSTVDALERADKIRQWILSQGSFRVLLLGRRVAAAFGLDTPWQRVEEFHVDPGCLTSGTPIHLVAIPHPSGLNHDYNDEKVRLAAGMAVRWAAGYV